MINIMDSGVRMVLFTEMGTFQESLIFHLPRIPGLNIISKKKLHKLKEKKKISGNFDALIGSYS